MKGSYGVSVLCVTLDPSLSPHVLAIPVCKVHLEASVRASVRGEISLEEAMVMAKAGKGEVRKVYVESRSMGQRGVGAKVEATVVREAKHKVPDRAESKPATSGLLDKLRGNKEDD